MVVTVSPAAAAELKPIEIKDFSALSC
jgi:hypothetical protein